MIQTETESILGEQQQDTNISAYLFCIDIDGAARRWQSKLTQMIQETIYQELDQIKLVSQVLRDLQQKSELIEGPEWDLYLG